MADYEPILPQYYDTIRSALSGQVPQGNLDFLKQQAAEYGIRSGMPGSDLSKYFGLNRMFDTSLGLTKFAAQALQPDVQSSLQQSNWLDRYNLQRANELNDAARARNEMLSQQWRNQGPFTPPIVSQGGVPMQPQTPRQATNRGGLNTNQMLSGLIGKYGGTANSPLNYQEQPTDTGIWDQSSNYWGIAPNDSTGGNILGTTPNIYMSPDTVTENLYGFGGLTPEQIRNAEDQQMTQEYGFAGLSPEAIDMYGV